MARNGRLLVFLLLALYPITAQAYIGPGVGAGALAAVLGVIGSIFLALFAIIYYPIKRMMKTRKARPRRIASKDPKPSSAPADALAQTDPCRDPR